MTAEEYFESKNGGKSAGEMVTDDEFITATWAVILMEEYAQQQTAVVERLRREDAASAIAEANDLRKQTEELRKRLEKEDEKALYIKITNERITRLRELLERCEQFIYENYELTIRGKLLADIEKELNPKP